PRRPTASCLPDNGRPKTNIAFPPSVERKQKSGGTAAMANVLTTTRQPSHPAFLGRRTLHEKATGGSHPFSPAKPPINKPKRLHFQANALVRRIQSNLRRRVRVRMPGSRS